ncbi:hypothetical protein ACOMHN_065180 [Nucella lapillus]
MLQELTVPAFFFPINMAYNKLWGKPAKGVGTAATATTEDSVKSSSSFESLSGYRDMIFHNGIIFQFILCTGVSVALGLLTLWHARLISRGETSIEGHINAKQRKRYKKKGLIYKNPYNFGVVENWRRFLGLGSGRSFWRHIVLPSRHDPVGDGLTWEMATHTPSLSTGLQLL